MALHHNRLIESSATIVLLVLFLGPLDLGVSLAEVIGEGIPGAADRPRPALHQ